MQDIPNHFETIRSRIIYYLEVYDSLSPSHLAQSLGATFKVAEWEPILDKLIAEGTVVKTRQEGQIPGGKASSHVILRLNGVQVSKQIA